MDKPKIYFVPPNIASLKYYERLIPYLENSYDVGFLLVRHEGLLLQQMADYCREEKRPFYILSLGIKRSGIRIPFFSPIRKMLAHEKACRDFIKMMRPAKLIFEKTTNPMSQIAYEANCLGIETIVLQWCFLSSMQRILRVHDKAPIPSMRKMYNRTLLALYGSTRLFYVSGAMNKERHVTPKKIGLFEEHLANRFTGAPLVVRNIGNLDIQMTHELKQRVLSDEALKKNLQEKYGLESVKKNILVFSSRVLSCGLKPSDYIAYYENVFADIRSGFPENEWRIIFKLHPKEDARAVQALCEKYNVFVYGGESESSELACLSHLCVSDTSSSVNFHVFGSGVPALFINFLRSPRLDAGKDDLHIKKIIHDRDEFRDALRRFKEGNMEEHYDNTKFELQSREKIVELINM